MRSIFPILMPLSICPLRKEDCKTSITLDSFPHAVWITGIESHLPPDLLAQRETLMTQYFGAETPLVIDAIKTGFSAFWKYFYSLEHDAQKRTALNEIVKRLSGMSGITADIYGLNINMTREELQAGFIRILANYFNSTSSTPREVLDCSKCQKSTAYQIALTEGIHHIAAIQGDGEKTLPSDICVVTSAACKHCIGSLRGRNFLAGKGLSTLPMAAVATQGLTDEFGSPHPTTWDIQRGRVTPRGQAAVKNGNHLRDAVKAILEEDPLYLPRDEHNTPMGNFLDTDVEEVARALLRNRGSSHNLGGRPSEHSCDTCTRDAERSILITAWRQISDSPNYQTIVAFLHALEGQCARQNINSILPLLESLKRLNKFQMTSNINRSQSCSISLTDEEFRIIQLSLAYLERVNAEKRNVKEIRRQV